MPINQKEFHEDFFQEILATADAAGRWTEDAFFELFSEYLIDAGEIETADRAPYTPLKGGMRVDGYGGDPRSSNNVLNIIIADFCQSPRIETLTATEMNAIFKRALNFIKKARSPTFRNSLEEVAPAFGLAEMIATRWDETSKIRIILISNRVLSSRVDGKDAGALDELPVTYSVWDLGRLHRFAVSGLEREELVVDLEKEFGGPLPILPAHLNEAGYEAYLIVVPAPQIAAIYDRWGARLLEQNVRVFLQARGNVNKGIRNTIENDPEMFFAYNNGLTATAESIETRVDKSGLVVTKLRNLQIVNGGQTTASIHAASRKKEVSLSRVFVQMKLSIVDAARAMDVVPKISQFANSQNRVNAADFFANHQFHVQMEKFSRRIFAPSPDGSFRASKWFYERARGQYQDQRGRCSVAQRKKFDLEFPKKHLLSKTDLAKFLNPWLGHPDTVSRGSQKNFAEFAKEIDKEWDAHPDNFNEMFYRHAVAKAIIFKETEALVSKQPWYQGGGIRSRVVPYAVAKLAHDASKRRVTVNFNEIWGMQALPDHIRNLLIVSSEAVHGIIAGSGNPNPLEWAKQPACWSEVKELQIDWPRGWTDSLLSLDEQKSVEHFAVKQQRVLNGIEAQIAVVNAGATFWTNLAEWGAEKRLLTEKERGILAAASNSSRKAASEKQCIIAMATLKKLQLEGCPLQLDS